MIRPVPSTRHRRLAGAEGLVEVFVADEQSAHPVDVARWETLAVEVLEHQGVSGDAELAILFIDEPSMAELNGRFMDAEGPTDVLAFPIDDDDVLIGRAPDASSAGPDRTSTTEAPLLLGDVVICPAVAARNAPTHAGTYDDELALLVVHGILHVLGMDHATDDEAAQMQARERALLAEFGGRDS